MTSESTLPKTCVLAGSESLMVQCGELLREQGWGIARVVTRDQAIIEWATEAAIQVCAPGRGMADRLRDVEFDYFFSITNLAIIPEEVLGMARECAINFHDGPLPRYAGMYTPAWAILNGESEYGVSFHEMTGGIDEGRILGQRLFDISDEETSLTLNTKCYAAAIEAFADLISRLESSQIEPREQDLTQRSYFGRNDRPDAAGVIDWDRSSEEIARWVRAMDFGARYANRFATAKLVHAGKVAIVRAARAGTDESDAAVGTLVAVDDQGLHVRCRDGIVVVSGLGCPRGSEWSPKEAASLLGLTVGDQVGAGTAAVDRAKITETNARMAPNEAFWLGRMARLDPIEAPYRTGEDEAQPATPQSREHASLVADFSGSGASNTDLIGTAELALATFAFYLARVQGVSQFDLTWGSETLREELAETAELFSPWVPLRIEIDPAERADNVISSVREAIAKVTEKGTFLNDLIGRDPVLQERPLFTQGLWTSVAAGFFPASASPDLPAGSDLGFFVDPKTSQATLKYDGATISPDAAERMLAQLSIMVGALTNESGRALPVASLPLMSEAERETILKEWNQSGVDFDRTGTIRSLFESRAASDPNATALVFEGSELSYRELDERAARLANYLVDLGIGPDRLVGLHLARSIDMLVGVLGVLKAGGAYVPLDPSYPEDRIAYMIEDSKASVVITHSGSSSVMPEMPSGVSTVDLDRDAEAIQQCQAESGAAANVPEDLAYVIYTSGSTGKPKGVMVEHRNVVNFFVGMDERVPHDAAGTWLAVTSLSFDISVLELLWTLTRGFRVVIFADRERVVSGGGDEAPWRPIDLGLALWGSDAGPGPKKYELMLESAKFADANGFCAVHTPERHFGAFGGPFPNPSVTGAAIAAVTEHIQIRASSCVLPLHHPVRVAEEWAVVDNISGGRVGVSFASGWQPNDFVIRPEAFANAKTAMFENAEIVRRLWRGEAVDFPNPHGTIVPTTTLPRPVQSELPTWITTAGNVDTFRAAGAAGVNVLTHLLGQSLEELAEKTKAYRQARTDAGHDPAAGVVTCMLHTFVGDDDARVRAIVREPMKDYLASSMSLVVDFAWSFPAFERPGGPDSKPEDVDLKSLSEDETDAILEFAFERYYETSGLFGTPEACIGMLERCKAADIDEIACLIDFGVDTQVVLESLDALADVRLRVNEMPAGAVVSGTQDDVAQEYSFAAQVDRYDVTHLQCTPSHATMLLTNPETRQAMGRIPHLMIGGEAFPISLAADLDAAGADSVTNMYGPTETTIWSSTEPVAGRPDSISIGRPIANTQLYILDSGLEPVPVGAAGELWIGGEGVVRGYLERPELTDERFVPDPFSDRLGARIYRTGDLARWTPDGRIDFLGRLDHQVKIRGYRIELGEIEARLASANGVRESVVVAREDTPGDVRLVAYAIAGSPAPDESNLRLTLRESLPDFMVPSNIVFLDRFPMTPNGKIDRKALPAPSTVGTQSRAEYVAPAGELEGKIAEVWAEVLHLDQVGTHDNFFDLGGHSLLVVQAHRKLRDVCEMPISLTDLYRFPTIAGLAEKLADGDDGGAAVQASQDRGAKRRQALGRRRRRGGNDQG